MNDDELRTAMKLVLTHNGLGPPEADIHSWRCRYPETYGECDCLSMLLDDLVLAAKGGYDK